MSKYGIRYKYNRRKGKLRGRDASESTIIRLQRQKLQEEEQVAALREFQEGVKDVLNARPLSPRVTSSTIFDNSATPQDVQDRIRQQDERYMSMLRQGEEITPEWRAYGQKRANSVGGESLYNPPSMKK